MLFCCWIIDGTSKTTVVRRYLVLKIIRMAKRNEFLFRLGKGITYETVIEDMVPRLSSPETVHSTVHSCRSCRSRKSFTVHSSSPCRRSLLAVQSNFRWQTAGLYYIR